MTKQLYRVTFETSLLIYSDETEKAVLQQAKRYLPYEVETSSKVVNVMPIKYLSSILPEEKGSLPYQNPGLPEITVDEILATTTE